MSSDYTFIDAYNDPTSAEYIALVNTVLTQMQLKVNTPGVSYRVANVREGSVIVTIIAVLEDTNLTPEQVLSLFNDAAGVPGIFATIPVEVGNPCSTKTCGVNTEKVQISATECQCQCLAGYIGEADNGCGNLDECTATSAPCGANADCSDTFGSYDCTCKPGFEGDGFVGCTDVIDCVPNDPCMNAQCFDVPGSYNCTCNPGTQPTSDPNVCTEICVSNHCLNGGTCSVDAVTLEKVCSCKPEFTGDRCQNPATYRTLAIVFGVLGGVILILLIVLLVVLHRRRKGGKLSVVA